jgi:hypothetical protein
MIGRPCCAVPPPQHVSADVEAADFSSPFLPSLTGPRCCYFSPWACVRWAWSCVSFVFHLFFPARPPLALSCCILQHAFYFLVSHGVPYVIK